MATLTMQQLKDRLTLDFRVVMLMRCPIMHVEAFGNARDLETGRNAIRSEVEAHKATHYRLDYRIKTLVGPGRFSDKTSVKIDLFANGNYPYSAPLCWVVDSEMPWSPHFREGFPICVSGDLWQRSGMILLGELLIHIAKLLNLDEKSSSENYVGYNPAATEYWHTVLNQQPIDRTLRYPILPSSIASSISGPIVNRILGITKRNKPKRPLRVFLCHSSNDKDIVRRLYTRLCGNGIDAWFDEDKLLPGQKWEIEIPRAVKNSDIVIVCLSKNAIKKSGYIQKEILLALDVANEKPEDTIFVIPFRLEPCEIPDRLRHLHCASLHEEDGYERLMVALQSCAEKIVLGVTCSQLRNSKAPENVC